MKFENPRKNKDAVQKQLDELVKTLKAKNVITTQDETKIKEHKNGESK